MGPHDINDPMSHRFDHSYQPSSMITGYSGGDPGSPPSDKLGLSGGLILGGLSLIGTIISAAMSNSANKSLVAEQNKFSIDQWNRENAYNSPSAQMRRLAAAGLNPNLIYGNGSGSMLSAPSPELHAAHNNPIVNVDPLTAAQIANINADTQAKVDENRRANELQPETLEQLSLNVSKSHVEVDSLKQYLESIKLDNERKETEIFVLNATADYIISEEKSKAFISQEQWFTFTERFLKEINLMSSEINANNASAKLSNEQAQQVDLMVRMASYIWEKTKGEQVANIHNDYVVKYYAAKLARLSSGNYNVEFWTNLVTGAISKLGNTAANVISSVKGFSTGDQRMMIPNSSISF